MQVGIEDFFGSHILILGGVTCACSERRRRQDGGLYSDLAAFAARGGLNASRPRLMDFLRRIHARPAYQRAIEHGGKYAF